MADKEFEWDDIKDPSMRVKFRDMGDGTYALIGSLPVGTPTEVALYALIDNTTLRGARLDASTHAAKTIDYAHAEVHSGSHFYLKGVEDLGNTATYYLLFAVPNTPYWPHLIFTFWHEQEMIFSITEGVTTGGDGTPITVFNSNRNSDNAAGMVVTHTPTTPVGGVNVYPYQRGSGKKAGGEMGRAGELELRANMKYLITATNTSASNCLFDYLFTWYEHEDKD